MRVLFTVTLALGCALVAVPAPAQVDLSRARELFETAPPRVFGERVALLTQAPLPGAVRAGDDWFALDARRDELGALLASAPAPLWWSPPRRLLLDRADGWVRASSFRNTTGLTGRGVVVGIIDSGIDPSHPDLQTPDGKTRVSWWLDFSRPAAGLQPELEAELGCDEEPGCAVMSGEDIDARLANDVRGDEPTDSFGHGTHVASLAAGNGMSEDPPRYVGVAPEASLIAVRVTGSGGGGILDPDVLKAANFVFERAEALGMPAVINLSLGSDFGAHDGSSALEQGLSSMIGGDYPGRAIVVAAGNSAGLFAGDLGVPSPLGVHTEVHVPEGGEAIVPIYVPMMGDRLIHGRVLVWISVQGDGLNVGLNDQDGSWIEPLSPGGAGTIRIPPFPWLGSVDLTGEAENLEVTIVNQTGELGVTRGGRGAIVVIDGAWSTTRAFALRLTGGGTAGVWLQSEGDLSPDVSPGALVPRAFKEGTINVPASAPDLIAVGATLNRTEWTDYQGNSVSFPQHGALEQAPDDTTAFFSSAGPNALGGMKPDLVAPGANVVGAMTSSADPRSLSDPGLFSALGLCPPGTASECFVVDEQHALTGGTSMAAPLVAGAIALLFERDPTLEQHQLRALLQAGARRAEGVVFVEQQLGAGALDLEGTLLAQIADNSPAERVPGAYSVLALAASFARPDPADQLWVLAELRDDDGAPADAFDPKRLGLALQGGVVASPLERRAPGLYQFALAAPAGSGGAEITVSLLFDGTPIVTRSVPIAVDHAVSENGVTARGGCAVSRSPANGLLFALALLLTAGRSRWSRSAARTARRRGRKDAPA